MNNEVTNMLTNEVLFKILIDLFFFYYLHYIYPIAQLSMTTHTHTLRGMWTVIPHIFVRVAAACIVIFFYEIRVFFVSYIRPIFFSPGCRINFTFSTTSWYGRGKPSTFSGQRNEGTTNHNIGSFFLMKIYPSIRISPSTCVFAFFFFVYTQVTIMCDTNEYP